MKLQLMSDLHTEKYENPIKFVKKLQYVPDLDFLVLAGDTVSTGFQSPAQIEEIFKWLASRARHLIVVDGNHEYYAVSQTLGRAILAETTSNTKNLRWLQNTDLTIEGKHFYGGAMWFPFISQGIFYKDTINDFTLIKDLKYHYEDCWAAVENGNFSAGLKNFATKDTIVISHHLPHFCSVPTEYHQEPQFFFVSDMTRLISEIQPRLWFHGHTHDPCDYHLGDTRVVCNPLGYPGEKRQYPPVVFEI